MITMAQLSQLMIEKSAVDNSLLKEIYRIPGITAYNRLEPRPRTENFERSLRAEIRDPLWMLTRQWQMGEFEAEDAGSAIDARLLTKNIHVDRISLDHKVGRQYDEDIPMETFVEREPVPLTYALRIQISQYFLKLHTPALKAKYSSKYLEHFPMDSGQESNMVNQTDSLNLYAATKARVPDGGKIYAAVINGTLNGTISADAGDIASLNAIQQQLQTWFNRQYSQPAGITDNAWHSQQLDYQFSIAAPDENGQQVVLRADQYYQGRLDWYAFDNELRPQPIPMEGNNGPVQAEEERPISFIPTPARFKGIPNPRFWEMEDRQIDFGKFNAKNTDQLLLVFAEFGLVYGNDWFMIPYKLPVNSLCTVKGLVITDVFGERTLISAADEGAENNWQHWSMFNLSNKDHIGQYNRWFFLPPSITDSLESAPLEEVNFIRDEMANMVFGIEDIIPDATGKGINGHEAADKTGVEPPVIENSTANIRYLLGTTVPENWIPFLPVHKPGTNQEIYFQRAAMPKLGNPPKDTVKAKGVLLSEVPSPYYINEEEIPYAGTIVTRSFQRVRWYNGKTYLWIGRYRETGRGEGSSKLRFDQIEPLKAQIG